MIERIDWEGRAHGQYATPHVHEYTWHVGPGGEQPTQIVRPLKPGETIYD